MLQSVLDKFMASVLLGMIKGAVDDQLHSKRPDSGPGDAAVMKSSHSGRSLTNSATF
jgi:hypothetical protein